MDETAAFPRNPPAIPFTGIKTTPPTIEPFEAFSPYQGPTAFSLDGPPSCPSDLSSQPSTDLSAKPRTIETFEKFPIYLAVSNTSCRLSPSSSTTNASTNESSRDTDSLLTRQRPDKAPLEASLRPPCILLVRNVDRVKSARGLSIMIESFVHVNFRKRQTTR